VRLEQQAEARIAIEANHLFPRAAGVSIRLRYFSELSLFETP
jgi:hypothetical protein